MNISLFNISAYTCTRPQKLARYLKMLFFTQLVTQFYNLQSDARWQSGQKRPGKIARITFLAIIYTP